VPSAPFRAPGVSLTPIDEIFDELGPTPRLCFEKKRWLTEYRRKLNEALGRLTLSYLEDMSFTRESLALDAVSDKMYMLKRSGVDVDSVEVDIMTITPFVASKIATRMRALERHDLARLFHRYIALPSTRKMAGDIFEAYCHVKFSTRIEFEFVPMVRIGGQTKTKTAKEPQWHSSHTEFPESKESKALGVKDSAETVSLSIDPSHVVDYSTGEVTDGLQVQADVYYIPLKTSQVGIDSFILHNNTLYLLQMTASDVHGIKNKLITFLLSLKGLPSRHHWHFIFVKPPRLHILVPDCAELPLHSAEVEVKS
jgi:hypothetical protein